MPCQAASADREGQPLPEQQTPTGIGQLASTSHKFGGTCGAVRMSEVLCAVDTMKASRTWSSLGAIQAGGPHEPARQSLINTPRGVDRGHGVGMGEGLILDDRIQKGCSGKKWPESQAWGISSLC